jgi:hypothetical protein
MKRVFALIAAVGGLMFVDLLCLIAATRAFVPNKPPMWLTGIFYWPLAWPVWLFAKLTGGPSFIAVLLAGLLDFALLYALLSFIERRWRRHQGAPTA